MTGVSARDHTMWRIRFAVVLFYLFLLGGIFRRTGLGDWERVSPGASVSYFYQLVFIEHEGGFYSRFIETW